ncbi:hypothetical protein SUGI_0844980 [Cryptomeria japonica]|nr:hypothetical protein SUGI_0844980 [Cryptomeria japonica]
MSTAREMQGFCKCFKSNQSAEPVNISCPIDSGMSKIANVDTDQDCKDETNQRIQGNSSTKMRRIQHFYTRNRPRQRRQQIEQSVRRQQIEQSVTPPTLGNFVQYVDVRAYSNCCENICVNSE